MQYQLQNFHACTDTPACRGKPPETSQPKLDKQLLASINIRLLQ
jgi:hypothetical protein